MSTNSNSVVHCAIGILACYPSKDEPVENYLQQTSKNLEAVKSLLEDPEVDASLTKFNSPTMQLVHIGLHLLQKVANTSVSDDDVASMISVQQQQKIKILLQLISSWGIYPGLVPGVNIPLYLKTKKLRLLLNEDPKELYAKQRTLWFVTPALIQLLKAPNLKALVLVHLGDILSALLQILRAKLKPPAAATTAESQLSDQFVMSQQIYDSFTNKRKEMAVTYSEMINEIYRPLIIKELMLLQMSGHVKGMTTPRWLLNTINKQLTDFLLSPGGVAVTLRACCPQNNEDLDWKKVDCMSNLISNVGGKQGDDNFCSIICPQVISLLNTTGTYCIPISKMCIKKLYEKDPVRCTRYIFDKIFEPFLFCAMPVNDKLSETLISEESISRCIDHITKCFTPGSQQSQLPFKPLFKIVKIQFKLYMKVERSTYQYKSALQDLLIRLLHSENDIDELTRIYNTLLFNEPHPSILDMNDQLEFQFGPSSGIQVARKQIKNEPLSSVGFESRNEEACDIMLDLLDLDDNYSKKLLYDLFIVLLNSLLSEFDKTDGLPPDSLPDLLDANEFIYYVIGKKEKRIMTIKLLARLSDHELVLRSIKEEPSALLQFLVRQLLDLGSRSDEVEDDEEELDEDDEFETDLAVALRIIDIMTVHLKTGSEDWKSFEGLISPLKKIKSNKKMAESVVWAAGNLYERIITQGAVHKQQLRYFNKVSKEKTSKKGHKDEKPKIVTEITEQSEVEKSLEMLNADDPPTLGYGLIVLEKLIRKNDPETTGRVKQLFPIVNKLLAHEDSYVYLSAISCLEALATTNRTDEEINILCDEYMNRRKDCSNMQLKIGEVLVKITRVSPSVSPEIRKRLINTFLFGALSDDDFLRASSLSNIAEVFKNVGFSCDPVLHEVCVCVRSIVMHDKCDMVRRAAVLLVTFIIKGYFGEVFLRLQDVLHELYGILVLVRDSDKDEVVRFHARTALEEIRVAVKDQFLRKLPLEKQISVLGSSK